MDTYDYLCTSQMDTTNTQSAAMPHGTSSVHFNTSRQRQNGCSFADVIFKPIFVYESWCMFIQNSLKSIPKGAIKNNSAGIGSDNGLAPNRRQAIIWTNDGLVLWRIYRFYELNHGDWAAKIYSKLMKQNKTKKQPNNQPTKKQ